MVCLAVAAVTVAVFTAGLGRIDLLDPDEGRHGEIAREMLADSHFVTPRLQGQLYDDKPVLFHWLAAASIKTFGPGAFAVRLPSALAGVWTVFITAWWAWRCWGTRTALLTATGLATTLSFVAIGRYAVVDMLFTSALCTALAWLGVCLVEDFRGRSPLPYYAAAAVAALVKGPVAFVLAGLVALGAMAIARADGSRGMLGRMRPFAGSALALAIVLPWYLAAWIDEPAYIEAFLWHHNLERYAMGGGAGFTHAQPWYYFAVALPLGLLPWFPLIAAGAVRRLGKADRGRADLYAAIWATAVVAFFLPSKTKLLTYVLPAFPPLLALGGAWLATQTEPRQVWQKAWRGFSLLWVAMLACTGVAVFAWLLATTGPTPATTVALVPAVIFLAAALLHSPVGWRRGAVAAAAASLSLMTVVYGPGAHALNQMRSLREAADIVKAELPPHGLLLAYGCAPHSLAFYTGRTVRRLSDPTEARAALASAPAAFLLTREKHLNEILAGPPLLAGLRWQGQRRVLVGSGAVAEKGGSRTLRRPNGPTSRF